ncbi:MAG: heme exporter protein CcmD [Acidiferrobacteraceae bacterium]|nr:heme exporter protein CcmD [Acidiferrobacteraceae bacterium]
MTITEFFGMGGYAEFVWPAYLITIIVLAGSLLLARTRHRRLRNIRRQVNRKNPLESNDPSA